MGETERCLNSPGRVGGVIGWTMDGMLDEGEVAREENVS